MATRPVVAVGVAAVPAPCFDSTCPLCTARTARLAPRIVQVVGVHDANHMVELVGPAPAAVEPVEVLRLLQHGHVSLSVRDDAGDVANRQNTPCSTWRGSRHKVKKCS